MAAISAITELLSKIQISDEPATLLKELKVAFASLQIGDLRSITENLNVRALFDCLNTSNREQLETACDVLKSFLPSVPPTVLLSQFHNELLTGLSHQDILVRELVMQQLHVVAQGPGASNLFKEQDMMIAIVHMLADDEISVAKQAQAIMERMGKQESSRSILFSHWLVNQITQVMKRSDIVRYRLYEVVVNISKSSKEALVACNEAALLKPLIQELEGDDILLQLNCMLLLTELASSPHGLQYLEDERVVQHLQAMIQSIDSNPLKSFILPGLLKFFGNVCSQYPDQILEKYRMYILNILDLASSNDPILQGIAIETIGHIGTTVQGKRALQGFGSGMDNFMKQIGSVVLNTSSSLRVKAINTICSLIEIKQEEQTNDIESLAEHWFKLLDNKNPMSIVVNICKQPFADFRLAMFGVLNCLARLPWGQQMIKDQPGFIEYLLDRTTESDKEGKEAKFDAVVALIQSPSSAGILGEDNVAMLNAYYKEGPFYVRTQAEILIEGSS